jgi:hypothetical protein
MVGMGREATLDAKERILRLTIRARNITAIGTCLAGIGRVYKFDRNTCQFSLVADKLPQLRKRPRVQLASLRASGPDPITYARQIFQGNGAIGALRSFHKLLANGMVYVGHKSLLTAGKPLENTLGRLRAFGLKPPALAVTALPDTNHARPAIVVSVAIGGYIGKAQVNAERAVNVDWLRRFNVTGNEQIKLTTDEAQIGLAPFALQQLKGTVTTQKRYTLLTATYCPDRHLLSIKIEGQDTVIVRECAMLFEAALFFLTSFVTVGDFRNGTNNHLSRKIETGPNVFVDKPVNIKLPEHFFAKCLSANPVTGGICLFKRSFEKFALFWRGFEFYLRRQIHIMKFSINVLKMQGYRLVAFPLPLKRGSLQARFL